MFAKRNNIQKFVFNVSLGTKTTSLVQPSILSDFQKVKVTYFDGDDKKEATAMVDDIYMLFNQHRLASLGKDTIQAWLNTLTPRSDALAQLRSKCSDEQLMQLCKSRYIQSPSELLAWSEYLNANYEQLVGDVKTAQQVAAEAAQKQAQMQAQQQSAASSAQASE